MISTKGPGRQMESLESKLERLSPEQRRELEDFLDFLLQRVQPLPALPRNHATAPPAHAVAPPTLTDQEPAPAPEPVKVYDLIRRQEPAPALPMEDPVTLLMQEIAVDDSLTDDYMDYGKYEQSPPSPATEAVKRVKEKLHQKKEAEPSKKLLDWID